MRPAAAALIAIYALSVPASANPAWPGADEVLKTDKARKIPLVLPLAHKTTWHIQVNSRTYRVVVDRDGRVRSWREATFIRPGIKEYEEAITAVQTATGCRIPMPVAYDQGVMGRLDCLGAQR